MNEEIAEGREEEAAIRLSPQKKIETEGKVRYNAGQLYLKTFSFSGCPNNHGLCYE